MTKENGKILGIILVLFIGIIICLAFIGIIADRVDSSLTPAGIHNESLDISSLRINNSNINTSTNVTLTKSTYIPSTVVISNVTNGTALTGHYSANSSGIYFVNDSFMVYSFIDNNTYASYSYYGPDYIFNSPTRTIISLIVLFTAIALIVYAISKILPSLRESVPV